MITSRVGDHRMNSQVSTRVDRGRTKELLLNSFIFLFDGYFRTEGQAYKHHTHTEDTYYSVHHGSRWA